MEEDIITKPVILAVLSKLLTAIIEKFDEEFVPRIMAKNLLEAMPLINSRYGTKFTDDPETVRFFYTLCIGIAHLRGDVRITPDGRKRLSISKPSSNTKKKTPPPDNGEFFSCANSSALDKLTGFLTKRTYNMVQEVEDTKGNPLVKLGYKKNVKDPREGLKERGIIWFPNKELLKAAMTIINQHRSKK